MDQGDDADTVYFLLKGAVEVLDIDRRIDIVRSPATLGEAALFAADSDEAPMLKRINGYRSISNCSYAAQLLLCLDGGMFVVKHCYLFVRVIWGESSKV